MKRIKVLLTEQQIATIRDSLDTVDLMLCGYKNQSDFANSMYKKVDSVRNTLKKAEKKDEIRRNEN